MVNGDEVTLEAKVQVLTKLGITSMQAKIYVFLCALGRAHAKTLSSLCKLPRQDTYKTLSELYDIGLVEKTISRPVVFRAIPTSRCLSLLVERQKIANFENEQLAEKVLDLGLKGLVFSEETSSEHLLLVPKKEPTLYRALDLVNSASESICVVSPHQNLFPWIAKENEALEKALVRNVRMRLVTDSKDSLRSLGEVNRIFQNSLSPEIRFLDNAPSVSFGIYDEKKLILELSVTGGFVGSDVIITQNPSMVEMAVTYFKAMWNQAR